MVSCERSDAILEYIKEDQWSPDELLILDQNQESRAILLIHGFVRIAQHNNIEILQQTPVAILHMIKSFICYPELIIKSEEKYIIHSDKIHIFENIIIQENGILTVDAWNGQKGGLFCIQSLEHIILHTNASINVIGAGYKGSDNEYFIGEGPGGGSKGCDGNYAIGDRAYGDKQLSKLYLGSGAGLIDDYLGIKGGDGGGIISILVSGNIIMHQRSHIVANGTRNFSPVASNGSGSGGSVLIKCNKLNMGDGAFISSKPNGRIRIDLYQQMDGMLKEEKQYKELIYKNNIKPQPFYG
eukprot:193008_1